MPNLQEEPELLKTEEAAKKLRVSVNSMIRLRLRGEGPEFLRVGNLVRYPAASLEDFIHGKTGF